MNRIEQLMVELFEQDCECGEVLSLDYKFCAGCGKENLTFDEEILVDR